MGEEVKLSSEDAKRVREAVERALPYLRTEATLKRVREELEAEERKAAGRKVAELQPITEILRPGQEVLVGGLKVWVEEVEHLGGERFVEVRRLSWIRGVDDEDDLPF